MIGAIGFQGHYGKIRKVLILILALNWLVAIAKIIYGVRSRCSSMTADGFHSLADGASNIIGIIGIHFACQPIDKDHPYGHKKYETFFSLGIAMLLFFISLGLIHESLERFSRPVMPQISLINFAVMLITTAINFWVMRYERQKGLRLKSDILVSDALHTKADILTSASVVLTLILIKMGYPILDPIATILIAIFIAHTGYDIVKHSSTVLCDTAAILDEKKIVDIVLGVNGALNCHKIRSRGREDDIYLDLHVQVAPDMPVGQAHQVSYAIEAAIKKNFPQVSDVLVHIEPKEN